MHHGAVLRAGYFGSYATFQRLRDGGGRFARELTAHAVWFERGS